MKKILALVFVTNSAWAQISDVVVPEIQVTGSAPTTQGAPGAATLSGERLRRKKRTSIGDTLGQEAGVASSQYGPNSGRPVARGLEGGRTKVLEDGLGVEDASAVSQDHAVAIDPLVIEKVELVRGPAALLYGSSTVGGVVNLGTNRIPEKIPAALAIEADTQFTSHDLGRTGSVKLDHGLGQKWAFHVDGALRAAEDYRVPQDTRIHNSFNRSQSFAAGLSRVGENGFLGSSVSNYNSKYGTIAEEGVHIDLQKFNWDVEGEWRGRGWVRALRAKNSYSNYKHEEIEGEETHATFKNEGNQARIDLHHQPTAGFVGRMGVEGGSFLFSTSGDEKFIPRVEQARGAFFIFEEKQAGRLRPSWGGRIENTNYQSSDDATLGRGYSRHFLTGSVALGLNFQATSTQQLMFNLSATSRAPSQEELFANGPHAATGLFEVGDPDLRPENGQGLELGWKYDLEAVQFAVTGHWQEFERYLVLENSGTDTGAPDNLPIYNIRGREARIYGVELEYRHRLPNLVPGGQLELEVKLDWLQGHNRDTNDPLPRLSPLRENVAVHYKADRYQLSAELERAEKQTQTAPLETETKDYILAHLGLEIPLKTKGDALWTITLGARNIFDATARNSVSILKDLAPLPGRSFLLGFQARSF